jgi:hypothetical protein
VYTSSSSAASAAAAAGRVSSSSSESKSVDRNDTADADAACNTFQWGGVVVNNLDFKRLQSGFVSSVLKSNTDFSSERKCGLSGCTAP